MAQLAGLLGPAFFSLRSKKLALAFGHCFLSLGQIEALRFGQPLIKILS